MLTLEEARLSLKVFKLFSMLNILPIQVDVDSGKIQRQSNRVKVLIWKFLFGVGVSHWLYTFVRLIQSTVIEPQKYFKWDHFVLHFAFATCFTVVYFTGFRIFVKGSRENVIIFNQLFVQREDPVQKIIYQQLGIQIQTESEAEAEAEAEHGNGKPGNKRRSKWASQRVSPAAQKPSEEGQNQKEITEKQHKSRFEPEVRPRPLLTWPPQYSLEELMAKLLPLLIMLSGVFAILILAIDPTRPQLLYSSLPPEWQNMYSFFSLLAVESLCMAVVLFTTSFSIVTQILFFGKVQLEFKRKSLQLRNLQQKFQNGALGVRHVEKEIWILRQILAEMRELVVFIELFNRCFPFVIFTWKLFSLSVSIVLYFFVIRHSEEFPILAVFSGYCAVVVTVIYTIMYEHAFSIPGKMEGLENEFLLTAQKTTKASTENDNRNKILWAEMKREIGRIQNLGIKVGSFHQMERESTPRFVDFVFRNVVTLLVMFPRKL